MTRICMIAYTHYPTDSRVRREAESLVARGDEVDFICLGEKKSSKQELFHGVHLEKINHSRYRGSSALSYLMAYFRFFVSAFFRVAGLYIKKRYPVIQVHTMPDFMVFTTLIPKMMGAKIILDVHDLMPELYQSKFGYANNHPLIRVITWVEKASIKFAHRAIAVHEPHLDALCSHGNPRDKFIQLLNLADEQVFKPDESVSEDEEETDLENFKLVYHGTVALRNGLETAIQAVNLIKDETPHLKFEIIGDGDDIDRLIGLVETLELEDLVHISKGMVPLEELVPRLKQADAGIVPLVLDEFTQYMLPVKLLEYVALGKPTICTRTKTIEAYFTDDMVLYFSSGNIQELADCILDLYHHRDKREALINKANNFIKIYNWNHQKQNYYTLVDGLIGG